MDTWPDVRFSYNYIFNGFVSFRNTTKAIWTLFESNVAIQTVIIWRRNIW